VALTGRDPAAPALDAGAGLADGLPRARPGLAYLVRSWPRLSQTFVLDEVLSLERLGFPVRVFALADPREPVRQPDLARVRAPVSYLDGAGALADHVRAALAAPGRYARAVWFVARHPESDRGYHGASRVRCLTFAVRLARLLGRDGASAHLHAHFAHDPALVALLTHRLVGIPWSFAAHARDLYQVPETALAERVASAAAAVTCCRAGAERLAAAVPERLRDRVRLIHHGVDVEAFRPGRAGAGQGHGPPLVVSVGRLVEKKGFPDLLDACRRLRDGGHAFRCVIYGDGPLAGELAAAVRRLGLAGTVSLAGSRTRRQLLPALQRADVFALTPFVTAAGDRDGIPNVVVEAMACGLPVVATAAGGVGEVVEHGVNGLLAAPRDTAAIAAHLGAVLADEGLRRRLGAAARRTVVERFDARAGAALLAALFDAAPGRTP